jgi:hypothetical protein
MIFRIFIVSHNCGDRSPFPKTPLIIATFLPGMISSLVTSTGPQALQQPWAAWDGRV